MHFAEYWIGCPAETKAQVTCLNRDLKANLTPIHPLGWHNIGHELYQAVYRYSK